MAMQQNQQIVLHSVELWQVAFPAITKSWGRIMLHLFLVLKWYLYKDLYTLSVPLLFHAKICHTKSETMYLLAGIVASGSDP